MVRPLQFTAEADKSLKCLFGTLRGGNKVDFQTRLNKKVPEIEKDAERGRVMKIVWDRCSLDRQFEQLTMFEIAKRLFVANRSRRARFDAPEGMRSQCESYFTARPRVVLNRDARRHANCVVRSLIPKSLRGKLRPIELDVAAGMFEKSGFGFPFMSSNVARFHEAALNISREIWESGCDPSWIAEVPAVAGYRSQQRAADATTGVHHWFAKTRFIYMMPRVLTNIEKTIQAPLLEALRANPRFCAWDGPDAVDREMTSLLNRGGKILSIDFKGFDRSIPFEVIDEVYKIIRAWFVTEASPLVDFCQEVFKGCGLLTPDQYYEGSMRSGGVPSGSVMTNLIDSLVNIWVMEYTAYLLKTEITAMYPQGDDGALSYTQPPSLDDLQCQLSKLGMAISLDKTLYTTGHVHFLQDLHSDEYRDENGVAVGVRPIAQVMANVLSFERVDGDDWDRTYDTVRWIQQITYCRHHPCATELADWLVDSDVELAEVVARLCAEDNDFILRAFAAVGRKDSNAFKGFSFKAFLSSPVFEYLVWRVS